MGKKKKIRRISTAVTGTAGQTSAAVAKCTTVPTCACLVGIEPETVPTHINDYSYQPNYYYIDIKSERNSGLISAVNGVNNTLGGKYVRSGTKTNWKNVRSGVNEDGEGDPGRREKEPESGIGWIGDLGVIRLRWGRKRKTRGKVITSRSAEHGCQGPTSFYFSSAYTYNFLLLITMSIIWTKICVK